MRELLMFADLVKARTDGKVLIDIYPNQQLSGGDLVKGLQMLQAGAIDMAFNSTIHYASVDPRFMVVSMPWIMPSYDAVDRIMDGPIGEQLTAMVRDNKVEPLALAGNGFRQITNNVREITEACGSEGIKDQDPRNEDVRLHVQEPRGKCLGPRFCRALQRPAAKDHGRPGEPGQYDRLRQAP